MLLVPEVLMASEKLTVTVQEAGELLGISRGHAYELVRKNELPHLRLGRRLVVPLRPLMAMIDGEGSPEGRREVGHAHRDG